MKKLFKYHEDFGRMGVLEGLFIEDHENVEEAMGCRMIANDILGKHSEIPISIKPSTVTELSDDQEKIEWLYSLAGSCVSGVDVMSYYNDMKNNQVEDE